MNSYKLKLKDDPSSGLFFQLENRMDTKDGVIISHLTFIETDLSKKKYPFHRVCITHTDLAIKDYKGLHNGEYHLKELQFGDVIFREGIPFKECFHIEENTSLSNRIISDVIRYTVFDSDSTTPSVKYKILFI